MNHASGAADSQGEATPMHFVSTLSEARRLVDENESYWVCNCGCREGRDGDCERSRIDVCLMFRDSDASGSGKRRISREEAEDILSEAESRKLVARPFRSDDRSFVEGICFCCDDCCGYFVADDEVCDKGSMIERTEMDVCTHCGACIDVCHFGARRMVDGRLHLERERCYGCGLCVDACPEKCVALEPRC